MGTRDRDDLTRPPEVVHDDAGVPQPRRQDRPRVIDIRHEGAEAAADAALRPYLTGRLLTAPEEVLAARVLHARVYVGLGWLPPTAVGEDGGLTAEADPWSAAADWFGSVRAGEVRAVARMLAAAELGRLPVLRLGGIPAAERRALLDLPAADVVEISALARRPDAARTDAPAVIAGMWRESLRRRHQAWVMAVDVAVYEMLRRRVVGTAIRAIGPEQPYLGSPVVPAVLRVEDMAPAQHQLAGRYAGSDPLPALLPRLFPAAPAVPR